MSSGRAGAGVPGLKPTEDGGALDGGAVVGESGDHVGLEVLVVGLGRGGVGEGEEDGPGAVGGAGAEVAPLGAGRRVPDDVGATHAGRAIGVAPEADRLRGAVPSPAGPVGGGGFRDAPGLDEREVPSGLAAAGEGKRVEGVGEAGDADVDAERDGEAPRAAVEAGDGLEVDGGPMAQERDEPGGVLGLDGADGLERAVGPEGVGVERVRDDEAGAVRDGELVVERERFDGVLVGLDADELSRDGDLAEAVAEREGDDVEGLARDVLGQGACRLRGRGRPSGQPDP